MRVKLLFVIVAAAFFLQGCGGGGDAGTSVFAAPAASGAASGPTGGVSTVSTAQATQKSISMSSSGYSLDWSSDGVEADVAVLVADTAGNPLPTGTLIQFSTQGGQIEKSCTIGTSAAGSKSSGCSVTFTTSNPRPTSGRVSLVAWLVGEESYKDSNGNGKYDTGEPFYESGTLFRDDDQDNAYTPGVDEIVVDSTISAGDIGIGTSACHQDVEAEPSVKPLSIPNTCDGVWGKTLIRANLVFATADSRDLAIASERPAGVTSGAWVKVYTDLGGSNQTAAPAGTTVTVTSTLPGGCTINVTPAAVAVTANRPTYHQLQATGCAGTSVTVRATSGGSTPEVVVAL